MSNIFPPIPLSCCFFRRMSLGTVSKALLKSTKYVFSKKIFNCLNMGSSLNFSHPTGDVTFDLYHYIAEMTSHSIHLLHWKTLQCNIYVTDVRPVFFTGSRHYITADTRPILSHFFSLPPSLLSSFLYLSNP